MKANETLEQLHRIRAGHAAKCGYDLDVLFAEMDAESETFRDEGWEIASFPPKRIEAPSAIVREDPPKP